MAFKVNDKEVDDRIDEVIRNIKREFGLKNVSKVDAIRFLLKIRQKDKKGRGFDWL